MPTDTHETYEAAVTIMMRIVFLLFAEERGLLPSGELFEQGYGISGELDRLQAREAEEGAEALDATSLTWHRLLATSRALFGGSVLLCRMGRCASRLTTQTPSFCSRQKGYSGW